MAPTELLDAEIAVRRVLGDWGGELVFLDLKPAPLSVSELDYYERRLADIRQQLAARPHWSACRWDG
jgi:hypothetical protein